MDLNKLSNEELIKIAGIGSQVQQPQQPTQDLNSLSNEDLIKIAGIQPPQQDSSFLQKAGQFAMGLPQALGNKAIGAVQSATTALGQGDSQFGKRLAGEVRDLKQHQAQLPPAERAGIATGEIATDLALTRGMGLTRAGAATALTTPLEDSSAKARAVEGGKDMALSYGFGKGVEYAGKGIKATSEGVRNIVKGIKAATEEERNVVAKGLKQKSDELYKAADEINARLKPSAGRIISKKIGNSILEDGPLFQANHGATMSVVNDIQRDITKKGGDIGFRELDQYSQALKDVIRNNTDVTGKINSDGYKALKALNKVDDIFEKMPDKYLINPRDKVAIGIKNEASKAYHTYRKYETVSNLAKKAGDDPNAIKRLSKNFVQNEKKIKGFSEAEKESLAKSGDYTKGEGLLKILGAAGIDPRHKVVPFLTAGAAGATFGGPVGAATITIGTAARQAQKYIARGKLDDALKLVQSSGNPSKVISQIPNRKMQEKLIQHFTKIGALSAAESN